MRQGEGQEQERSERLRGSEPVAEAEQWPEHLARLGESEWGMWRWVGLRAAGFSVEGVRRLGAEEAAEAAERVMEAEGEAEARWETAVAALSEAMSRSEGEERGALQKALRRLKKGKAVAEAEVAGSGSEVEVEAFVQAMAEVEAAYSHFNRVFEEAADKVSEEIRGIARDERFREAIVWQNHRALHSGVNPLLRNKPGERRDSKDRRNEEMIASYWQRYCVKNDTIGFFGPVGWGRLDDRAEMIEVQPGADLLARRNVYLEGWCIDKLAETLYKDERLKPWLAPHKMPSLQIHQREARILHKDTVHMSVAEAIALSACDGERTAKEIAKLLTGDPASEIQTELQAYQLLAGMETKGLIFWTPIIPQLPYPERILRQMLERIDDPALRAAALEPLDALESCRARIIGAAGNAELLDVAFTELESKFKELTGQASTRDEGKTYAGRTLVYEDCQRDIDVKINPKLFETIAQPLSLILASARWLTYVTAEDCRKIFTDTYSRLRSELGQTGISATVFWARVQSRLLGSSSPFGDSMQERFQDRWAEILAIPDGQRAVQYNSEQLGPRVLAAFDAPHSGWQYARYHCPDFMIAAASLEAIQKGEFQFVMGELHIATLTLSTPVFINQHPSPEDMFQGLDADIPIARLVHAPPKLGHSSRDTTLLTSAKDFYLEIMPGAISPNRAQAIQIGSLMVEEQNHQLRVKTLDGKIQFDIMEAFASLLTMQVMNNFRLIKLRDYTPRVTIDRLVVSRETWRMAAREISFAFDKDDALRFLNARRWAAELGLPRYVFYKSPIEVKPVYLDLESPVLVNLFARVVRRTAQAGGEEGMWVSEMLPGPDEVWLGDGEGKRYTSELRLVAVDERGTGRGR